MWSHLVDKYHFNLNSPKPKVWRCWFYWNFGIFLDFIRFFLVWNWSNVQRKSISRKKRKLCLNNSLTCCENMNTFCVFIRIVNFKPYMIRNSTNKSEYSVTICYFHNDFAHIIYSKNVHKCANDLSWFALSCFVQWISIKIHKKIRIFVYLQQ